MVVTLSWGTRPPPDDRSTRGGRPTRSSSYAGAMAPNVRLDLELAPARHVGDEMRTRIVDAYALTDLPERTWVPMAGDPGSDDSETNVAQPSLHVVINADADTHPADAVAHVAVPLTLAVSAIRRGLPSLPLGIPRTGMKRPRGREAVGRVGRVVGADRAAVAEGGAAFPLPGRKRLPDRRALQGILFVLHTGIAWGHLPLELGFGGGSTRCRRMSPGSRQGSGSGCTRCCWPSPSPGCIPSRGCSCATTAAPRSTKPSSRSGRRQGRRPPAESRLAP